MDSIAEANGWTVSPQPARAMQSPRKSSRQSPPTFPAGGALFPRAVPSPGDGYG